MFSILFLKYEINLLNANTPRYVKKIIVGKVVNPSNEPLFRLTPKKKSKTQNKGERLYILKKPKAEPVHTKKIIKPPNRIP